MMNGGNLTKIFYFMALLKQFNIPAANGIMFDHTTKQKKLGTQQKVHIDGKQDEQLE